MLFCRTLLFLSIFIFSHFAYCTDPLICITIVKKLSPYKDLLALGDRVTLSFSKTKQDPIDAIFLGIYEEDGDRKVRHFFLGRKDGRLYSASGAQLSSETDPNIGHKNIQKFSIDCQKGLDCSVHSTFGGLKLLFDLGLASPFVQQQIEKNPKKLFDTIAKSSVNGEVHERGLEGASFWQRLLTPSVSENRVALLREMGIDAKNTNKMAEIKRHLKAGRPVILDVDTSLDTEKIYILDEGGKTESSPRTATRPHVTGDGLVYGHHSVLAIGFIPTGIFAGKTVILDSSTGRIHIWDWAELKEASPNATLLGKVSD